MLHTIETRPNNARYFLGLVMWSSGQLEEAVEDRARDVRPATVDAVLPEHTAELWETLAGTAS